MSSHQKQQQKNGENNVSQFKKVGVIFNPAANKGYAKIMFEELVHPLLIKYFGERIHQVFETRKAGGGFDGAVQMAKEGCDLILACGGDGTLHEVVNGLLKKAQNSDAQELLPAISVLPLGTSDDFATHVQLSCKCVPQLSKEAAYESFVESLSRSGTVLNIDIGSVTATKVSINQETQVYDKLNEQNTEYFINEASCGIGADVIDTVNRASSLWNKAFYNSFQALWKQFTYQNRDLEWKLTNENDETVVDSGVSQLLVMGNARYFGNGMMICPDALLNDGLFQITHLSNVNAVNALSIIPKLFSGTQSQHPKVTHHTAVKAEVSCIRSDADAIVLIEADGEIAGALPATFSIVRDAIRFVVPSTHPLYGH